MNRIRIFLHFLTTLNVCLVAPLFQTEHEPTPLDFIIPNIPEIGAVQTWYVRNSTCVLIHVRQRHSQPLPKELERFFGVIESPGKTEFLALEKKRSFEELDRIQHEIVSIVFALQKKLGITCIYPEGMDEQAITQLPVQLAVPRSRKHASSEPFDDWASLVLFEKAGIHCKITESARDHDIALFILQHKMDQMTTDLARILETRKAWKESTGIRQSAMLFLKFDKEFTDFKARSSKMMHDPRFTETREDTLLSILEKDYRKPEQKNRMAVTVFGGGHDWTDNIERWNRTNLFKFSLITITPRSLK